MEGVAQAANMKVNQTRDEIVTSLAEILSLNTSEDKALYALQTKLIERIEVQM